MSSILVISSSKASTSSKISTSMLCSKVIHVFFTLLNNQLSPMSELLQCLEEGGGRPGTTGTPGGLLLIDPGL